MKRLLLSSTAILLFAVPALARELYYNGISVTQGWQTAEGSNSGGQGADDTGTTGPGTNDDDNSGSQGNDNPSTNNPNTGAPDINNPAPGNPSNPEIINPGSGRTDGTNNPETPGNANDRLRGRRDGQSQPDSHEPTDRGPTDLLIPENQRPYYPYNTNP